MFLKSCLTKVWNSRKTGSNRSTEARQIPIWKKEKEFLDIVSTIDGSIRAFYGRTSATKYHLI